jgi:hypothetical protein
VIVAWPSRQRLLKGCVQATTGNPEWDIVMKQIQSAIGCTYNKSTGIISIEVLAGYKTTGQRVEVASVKMKGPERSTWSPT